MIIGKPDVLVGDFSKNPFQISQKFTAEFIVHKDYNMDTVANDIAILRLPEPVPRSRIIKMCHRSYFGEGIFFSSEPPPPHPRQHLPMNFWRSKFWKLRLSGSK